VIVEHDMHDEGSGRRSGLRNLFAERRVHVRSGHESRYVVLSPLLQIGVAVGALALVALLGVASYNAISGQLALITQQRELALLAADKVRAEQAAAQLEALQRRHDAAESEITRLSEALAQAEDDTDASARLAAAQAELDAATAENRKLVTALEQARAAGQASAAEADAPQSTEVEALRAEITGLRAEIDRLEREAQGLRRSAAQAQEASGAQQPTPEAGGAPPTRIAVTAEPAVQEVRRLQQDLAGAQAAIDALSADLAAAKSPRPGAGPARQASIAATDLSSLKAQLGAASERLEQLGASLVAAPGVAPRQDLASDTPAGPAPRLPSPPAPR
jgi:DNA repair exonuclease SbcCD ATPase subunit